MSCRLKIALSFVLLSSLCAEAKQESFWIEKVAILAAGQGVCNAVPSDQAMQTAIGAAMIEHAINKKEVIRRARKRAHRIADDIAKHRTQAGFCDALPYYLERGYPK